MTQLRHRWKRLRVWMFLQTASVENRRKLCAALAVAAIVTALVTWITQGEIILITDWL
jgi:hypothetical protein